MDHIIQLSGVFSIWILEYFIMIIKPSMEKIVQWRCTLILFGNLDWKIKKKKKKLYLKGEKEALSQPAKSVKLTQWANQPVANERNHTFFYFMTNCDTLLLSYAILKVMLSGIASHLDFPEVNCHFLFYTSLLQHYFKDTHKVDWEKSTHL